MAAQTRSVHSDIHLTKSDDSPTHYEVRFIPEPSPQKRWATLISVDDHIIEPPDTFAARMPAKYEALAPRVIETENGAQAWLWNDELLPNVGLDAVAGREWSSWEERAEPGRFEDMRPGCWNIDERVKDMDISGVWSSLCFPSFLPGFVGQRFTLWPKDEDLAFAVMRAYNDWHLDTWCGSYPDRFIPNQIPWLRDPQVAAAEIRRNAERGFKAVTFSELPHMLGVPSIHGGYWDPFFAACEETETVVCLHVGSSGSMPATAPDAPIMAQIALFFAPAISTAAEWVASKVAVRFPNIKICLSEGGTGWVAGLLDRFEHVHESHRRYAYGWADEPLSPADIMRRNFWFCALDDPTGFMTRDAIGVDHILIESDYPHSDSNWPTTQDFFLEQMKDVPVDEQRRMCWQNAVELFRLPQPPNQLP